jgi:hypothetical protein
VSASLNGPAAAENDLCLSAKPSQPSKHEKKDFSLSPLVKKRPFPRRHTTTRRAQACVAG